MRRSDGECANASDRRKSVKKLLPGFALIARTEKLAASCSEIEADGIETIRSKTVTQNGFIGELLWQAAE